MHTPTQIQAHIARCSSTGVWEFLALKRTASETAYPNLWQTITGSVNEGETAVQTVFREIEEETGFVLDELWIVPYIGSYFEPRRNTFVMIPCFAAVVSYESAIVQLSSEHSEYRWCSFEEALALYPMPSHIEATRIVYEHILTKLDTAPFRRVYREL